MARTLNNLPISSISIKRFNPKRNSCLILLSLTDSRALNLSMAPIFFKNVLCVSGPHTLTKLFIARFAISLKSTCAVKSAFPGSPKGLTNLFSLMA